MNLLTSKFFLPDIQSNHLSRKQDIKNIATKVFSGVTYVVAPAGFGKSTFTSEWVRRSEYPNLWLSLEATESDFYMFACYLLQGLKQAFNKSFSNSEYFCQSDVRREHRQFLIALLNELEALEFDYTIVLDDFYLAETESLQDFISYFINNLPKNCRLIIVSRTSPKLTINKLKPCLDIVEISGEELRFTDKQISQYLQQNSGLSLDSKVIESISEATQGWVVLIKLIELNSRLSSSSLKVTGSDDIKSYVVNEVLSQLPKDVSQFLYQTANLHSLNADFCDVCLEHKNSSRIINYLKQEGLFIVPLDNEENWYRYHHLFADILMSNRPAEIVKTVSTVHSRAAQWLKAKGLTQMAFQECERSGDDDFLLSMMEQAWLSPNKDIWLGSNDEYLNAQIKRVGQEFCFKYPYLYSIYGLNNLALEPELSMTLLRKLQIQLEELEELTKPQKSALTISYLGEAYVAAAQHNYTRLQQSGNKALTLLRQEECMSESEHAWLGSANILMASAHWNSGNMLKAQELMLDGVEHMEKTSNASAIFSTYFILIHVLYGSGKNKLATKYIKIAMSRLDVFYSPLPQGAAEVYLAAAYAEFEHGRVDSAIHYLDQAENLLVESGIHEAKHFYPLLQAKICFVQGEYEKVSGLLEKAKKLRTITPFSDATDASYWQVRLSLMEENELFMNNWWEKQTFEVDHTPLFEEELNYLNWVHWGLLTGKFAGSEQYLGVLSLEKLAQNAADKHRYRAFVEAKTLMAFVQINQNDDKYKVNLNEAIEIAEINQIVFYVSQFPAIKCLLEDGRKHKELPNSLLKCFYGSNEYESEGMVESLSPAELKILSQLQTELSGPEICKQSFISLNTFRTHTKNIYSKLCVNSRLAAVNKGKKFNLI